MNIGFIVPFCGTEEYPSLGSETCLIHKVMRKLKKKKMSDINEVVRQHFSATVNLAGVLCLVGEPN
jgi:hypothetical protein